MQILETTAQSYEIEKIFTDSDDFTVVVSPFLKINNRLKSKISDCYGRNVNNIILYRQNELTKVERDWMGTQNVTLLPIKNLHAKCYLNEKTALITSMNLYDYSQINNHEIGVKLTLLRDKEEISRLIDFIHSIIKTDHPSFDFSYISTAKSIGRNYTMGKLYTELVSKYDFPNKFSGEDGIYRYICNVALSLHNFSPDSYYFDKSALLRSAPLDNDIYEMLKKELIKVGNRKN